MDSTISSHKEQGKLIFSFTIIKAFFYQNTKENKGRLGLIFTKPARPTPDSTKGCYVRHFSPKSYLLPEPQPK